jgi:hypothetical protein
MQSHLKDVLVPRALFALYSDLVLPDYDQLARCDGAWQYAIEWQRAVAPLSPGYPGYEQRKSRTCASAASFWLINLLRNHKRRNAPL